MDQERMEFTMSIKELKRSPVISQLSHPSRSKIAHRSQRALQYEQ